MVEFTKGDMFEAAVDLRVNTVNCVGVMGAGVALAFKNRYPDMFKDYQNACRDGRVRPGTVHVWKSLMGDWVINFPTKRDWRGNSRYEDIQSGLDALRNYLSEQGNISVALPALGCGHGGLDWSRVAPMIEERLGDLEAHVFVFEPADSLNAGKNAHAKPTEEQLSSAEGLGFKSVPLTPGDEPGNLPTTAMAKGEASLMNRQWLALLPSKDITEREEKAIDSVARQMALSGEPRPVAVVHATRSTERIAELFLRHGVPVVLILPFGPLARKSVARIPTERRVAPFAIVSLAAPSAAWSRQLLAQSMHLLKSHARSVLLTDPAPNWLSSRLMHGWAEKPVFYLRYDGFPEQMLEMLNREGAHPIGRRPDTGEPNLALLFRS
jgi:O-acetyl-ADP-ribose deacetylase (regulator of RNase III)